MPERSNRKKIEKGKGEKKMTLGGMLGKLTSLVGAQPKSAPVANGFPSSLSLVNGDAAYNTAAEVIALLPAAGANARIWEYTVPAQQAMRWGFGSPLLPDNQGYIFFALIDATTAFCEGFVTLSHENHSRRVRIPVNDRLHDARLHSATNTSIATARLLAKDQMVPLPENQSVPKVGQDSRLVIDYQTITRATTEDVADFNIPVTVYE